MSNIDYDAAIEAIDEALQEAVVNESETEASMVMELEPDPTAEQQKETVQEEVDLGQYFQEETQGGLQEAEETAPETLEETPLETQEETAETQQEETDPPSIEERLDDLTDLLAGLHELVGQLVGNMEEQSKSIDSIGARVIEAVTTVMQHSGTKVPPGPKPAPAPAVEKEEAQEGPSEAEKANLETITALKERRT